MHGIKPIALCAAKNTALLEKQAREFMPEAVCIYDENRYSDMKQRLSDTDIKVLSFLSMTHGDIKRTCNAALYWNCLQANLLMMVSYLEMQQ